MPLGEFSGVYLITHQFIIYNIFISLLFYLHTFVMFDMNRIELNLILAPILKTTLLQFSSVIFLRVKQVQCFSTQG